MRKRILIATLIAAIIATGIGISTINKSMIVAAENFRNGYALIPQKQDATGIDTKTLFVFESKRKKVTQKDIQNELKVSPNASFKTIQQGNSFLIAFEKELQENTIYTFEFRSTTWTFQTMSDFKLVGSLPRDKTSNVPINTGIELYFSHTGANVKDYFQIEPKVEGEFKKQDNVIVFVPKELKKDTVYKITVKKGLPLANSKMRLNKDYEFSFSTVPSEQKNNTKPNIDLWFNQIMYEFGQEDQPVLPVKHYLIDDKNIPSSIKTNIYSYTSNEKFIEDVKNKYKSSEMIQNSNNILINTNKLNKVLSFEQPFTAKNNETLLNLPKKLSNGYYLVDCQVDNQHFQTFIQVTDINFYFTESKSKNMMWLHNRNTGKNIIGAKVVNLNTKKTYISNDKGVTLENNKELDDLINIYKIKNSTSEALFISVNKNEDLDIQNNYYRYLQTNKMLYYPDETIKLWGYIKNRYEERNLENITLEISQSGYKHWKSLPYFGDSIPYVTKTIDVNQGFFTGNIKLPNLEQGSYQITLKNKDETIVSKYIEVKEYVKPAYKIEIESDNKAVFAGEKINFKVLSKFYEETPASNINMKYNIDSKTGEIKTNQKGIANITYKTNTNNNNMKLNVTADLPESSTISASKNIRVFMNDINVKLDTKLNQQKRREISVQLNEIDLKRLNEGTAKDSNDYLGNAVSNHHLTGVIYKNEWKKKEVGEYYNFIDKIVEKKYEYYTEKKKYKTIKLKTDKDGKVTSFIDIPLEKDCYYTLELLTKDKNGKEILTKAYLESYKPETKYKEYELRANKEKYNLNETVNLEMLQNKQSIKKGQFLYYTAQNGIKTYEVSKDSSYEMIFSKSFIPNMTVFGVYYNGKTYVETNKEVLSFNTDQCKLELKADLDKTSYKPNEECKVKLKAQMIDPKTKEKINVKDVYVNISIVDEALFSLQEQNVDPLNDLYQWVADGKYASYSSHYNYNSYYNNLLSMSTKNNLTTDMTKGSIDKTTSNNTKQIRSDFKDTALFKTVKLNNKGEGTVSFKLPDNITAFRMVLAGISKTLLAGSNKQEIKVSLPFFINTSIRNQYLVGDEPYIGISSYGNSIKKDDEVNYEISCSSMDLKKSMKAKAFERINLPIGTLKKKGKYDLIIKAKSTSGYQDIIKQTIEVKDSYHNIEVAENKVVKSGMKLKSTSKGMTKLTFVDEGQGKYMPLLYKYVYSDGARLEKKYSTFRAKQLLKEIYKINDINYDNIKLSSYQTSDGGLAILPYAESDIKTTVKMLPLIKDSVNTEKIKLYLYNELYSKKSNNKSMAIYGLSILNEPVLKQLKELEELSNKTLKDNIYIALTYAEIGDKYYANNIYKESIKSFIQTFKKTSRIKCSDNDDDNLEHTALVMMLASKLNLDNKSLLYDYVSNKESKEQLTNIELIQYIINELKYTKHKESKISYEYNNKRYSFTIKNGIPKTIKLPSSKINTFKIKKVNGKVNLVTINTQALSSVKVKDNELYVKRSYIQTSTGKKRNVFNQSDIVKVKLQYNINKAAIDDVYSITDYVPSGLEPINNIEQYHIKNDDDNYFYTSIDGQKVTFFVNKNSKRKKELYYYARVVTTGKYKAEGVVMQGQNNKESLYITSSNIIRINP